MKKYTAALCIALGACTFWGCTKKEGADKPVRLVMAEVNPPDTIAGQMDAAFKQKVEELSGGSITIDLECSGILGDEKQIMNLLSNPDSTIHIFRASVLSLAPYGCSKTAMLSIPYLFASRDQFWRFSATDTAREILQEPLERGLAFRGLFFGEEGFRNFFARKPLTSIQDFAGLKVRTTNDAIMNGIVTGLKASPVAINFTDLYSALQTGEADAAEQPLVNYLSNHFPEVAPYMILDRHSLGIMEMIISEQSWQSLSSRQQQILLEAGDYASSFCRELSQKEEERVLSQLAASGASIVDVSDSSPWKEACEQVIQAQAADNPAAYKQILQAAHTE